MLMGRYLSTLLAESRPRDLDQKDREPTFLLRLNRSPGAVVRRRLRGLAPAGAGAGEAPRAPEAGLRGLIYYYTKL